MAQVCEICGKGVLVGNNVSHANNRNKRRFKPNLKTVRLEIEGLKTKIKLCMSCFRKKKDKLLEVRKKDQVEALSKKAEEMIEKAKKGQEHFSIV